MLSDPEVKIIYHLIDSVFPDLGENEYGRYELVRNEYTGNISFSAAEYKALEELKGKIQGHLLSCLFKKET